MISLDNASIDLNGDTVDSASAFEVTVPPGWFMIGNPFNFAVSLSGLKVSDGSTEASVTGGTMTTSAIYYYENNDYVKVTDMLLPNRGYWIKNRTSASVTIKIPPVAASSGTSASVREKVTESEEQPPPPPFRESAEDGKGMCFIATCAYEKGENQTILNKVFNWMYWTYKY